MLKTEDEQMNTYYIYNLINYIFCIFYLYKGGYKYVKYNYT